MRAHTAERAYTSRSVLARFHAVSRRLGFPFRVPRSTRSRPRPSCIYTARVTRHTVAVAGTRPAVAVKTRPLEPRRTLRSIDGLLHSDEARTLRAFTDVPNSDGLFRPRRDSFRFVPHPLVSATSRTYRHRSQQRRSDVLSPQEKTQEIRYTRNKKYTPITRAS